MQENKTDSRRDDGAVPTPEFGFHGMADSIQAPIQAWGSFLLELSNYVAESHDPDELHAFRWLLEQRDSFGHKEALTRLVSRLARPSLEYDEDDALDGPRCDVIRAAANCTDANALAAALAALSKPQSRALAS